MAHREFNILLHFMCISTGFYKSRRPSRPGEREGHIIGTTYYFFFASSLYLKVSVA